MSATKATNINTTPNQTMLNEGTNTESSKPKPRPNKLCISECDEKQDFI